MDKDRDRAGYKSITITSGYGANTRAPYVQMDHDGITAQMSPDEARQLARHIAEAAEAAEGDAFMVEFMRDKIGLDIKYTAGLLDQYRQWRSDRRQNKESK
jgi:hypothetical protein